MTDPGRGTRAALAVISGLALAAAFPKVDLSLLAWVAFVPLLYVIDGQPLRSVALYAWFQGFADYVASVYWIAVTLHNFTSLDVGLAVAPMLLLAAIMAVFTAAAFTAASYSSRRLQLPITLTLPIAWTGIEWLRTYFPIGFPWNLLGYTVYRNLQLIQFAEFTGVYGVSALIIFANTVVYTVALQADSRRTQLLSLAALTIFLISALVYGSLRIHGLATRPHQHSLKAAMVQGNIPQAVKWSPQFLDSSFQVYSRQSAIAARRGADLLVWPEAAAAFLFQPDNRYPAAFAEDALYRARLLNLARGLGTPILFGAPALAIADGTVGFYNRAYLVTADGKVDAWYDKIQLVPFGEYVPLRALLGTFVRRVAYGFGEMIAGRSQTIFRVKDARLAVLICYESIFPDLARRAVKNGAEILVNITNDAWYGESSAPYQLLAMSAMRSVENKVPMVRVANTGISAVIEPTGRITAPTPIFTRGSETETVTWSPERTLYTRIGDLFAETCFVLTIAALIAALLTRSSSGGRDHRIPAVLMNNGGPGESNSPKVLH